MTARSQSVNVGPAGATEPEPDAEHCADVRSLVRLVAGGGCGIENMRLVRCHVLRTVAGEHWAAVGVEVMRVLGKEIQARLGRGDLCVTYDEDSFLVLCPGADRLPLKALDGEFAATVGGMLAGILGTSGLIEVLKPASVDGQGLTFATTDLAIGDAKAGTAAGGRGRASKLILGDATFRYFPLWDVGANSVHCYLWEASWDHGTGAILPEEALADQFDEPHRVSSLDLETLEKAIEELDRDLNEYRLAKFLIPVHFQTLADPATAEAYLKVCNARMWSVREFAMFEIVKPPRGAKADRLAKAAELLAPFGAGVMLRANDRLAAGEMSREVFMSIGIDIRIDRRPEAEIAGDIKFLAETTRRDGLKSHVHGIHAATPSVIAACAAIDFVGTDAVAGMADEPRRDSSPVRSLELLRKLAGAKARRVAG